MNNQIPERKLEDVIDEVYRILISKFDTDAFPPSAIIERAANWIEKWVREQVTKDMSLDQAVDIVEEFVRDNEEGNEDLLDAWHKALNELDYSFEVEGMTRLFGLVNNAIVSEP